MWLQYVKVGETVILFPDFYHGFGLDNKSPKPCDHTYKGSFLRHRTLERVLLRMKRILTDVVGDACPVYTYLNAAISIFFGFNCGFPKRDIAMYVAWVLGFYKPSIYHGKRSGIFVISDEKKLNKYALEEMVRQKSGKRVHFEQI